MTSTRAREESERETRPLVASARGRDAGDMARGSAKRRATPLNERPSSSVFERARGALCVVVACAVVGLLFAVTPESTLGRRRWPARAGGARALGVPPGARDDGEPRVFAYDVAASYTHDSNAFTQGLAMCGTGVLCESTGAVSGMKSAVRATELATGKVLSSAPVDGAFAEGLARVGRDVHVISWRTNKGFSFTLRDDGAVAPIGTFETPLSDGWGLAELDGDLYATDATDKLHVMSPPRRDGDKVTKKRSMTVTDDGNPLRFTNELEAIGGEVYANVLERPCLARIDPASGKVTGWVNLSGLKQTSPNNDRGDVLNGIAYDESSDKLYVTGKMWPTLFEIRLRDVTSDESLDEARRVCTPSASLPQYGYP